MAKTVELSNTEEFLSFLSKGFKEEEHLRECPIRKRMYDFLDDHCHKDEWEFRAELATYGPTFTWGFLNNEKEECRIILDNSYKDRERVVFDFRYIYWIEDGMPSNYKYDHLYPHLNILRTNMKYRNKGGLRDLKDSKCPIDIFKYAFSSILRDYGYNFGVEIDRGKSKYNKNRKRWECMELGIRGYF